MCAPDVDLVRCRRVARIRIVDERPTAMIFDGPWDILKNTLAHHPVDAVARPSACTTNSPVSTTGSYQLGVTQVQQLSIPRLHGLHQARIDGWGSPWWWKWDCMGGNSDLFAISYTNPPYLFRVWGL